MKNNKTDFPGDYAPRAQVFLLFSFFFLIITSFWCMKPLRTAGVVKALGPDLYPLVKQGSLLFVPLVMFFYEAMVARLSRGKLVALFTTIFTAGSVVFWALFTFAGGTATKIGFFYYVDIYVTVMVALFWTYLNSVFKPGQAKRYYGIIGAGGLVGGILGSSIAGWASAILGANIILVAAGVLSGVLFVIARLEATNPSGSVAVPKKSGDKMTVWQSCTEGVRLVASSRYLTAIVAIVGIYEVASTIVDYQFNASAAQAFASETDLAGYQGRVYFIGQLLSLAVMVFVTPFVFKRFGVAMGLMLLPVAMLTGSVAFLFVPLLATITFTTGAETSFAYSINQASKEILYVPLDATSKFKAKAFIDMFVFRFAKTAGAALTLAYITWLRPLGMETKYLMLVNAAIIGIWIFAIRVAGKEFAKTTAAVPGASRAASAAA